jgi:hypothetical protein
VQLLLLGVMTMYQASFVGDGAEVESHHACVVYDEKTGEIRHIHEVINLVGSDAPNHEQMMERARANTADEDAPGLAVLVLSGAELERGKAYRVDPKQQALVVDEDRSESRSRRCGGGQSRE